jgi:spore maturation protein SpmA
MLNYIWLALVVAAVLMGGFTGHMKELTDAAFDSAKAGVMTLALPLIGVMSLWLGIMRIAEKSGLIQLIARALRPILRILFPDVPPDHPAMGAMVMNIASNMLGLGNSATPLGLRAMQHLERLNPRPGTATNAMCTFLAINTSSVQLIPATAVGILAAAGSTNPTAIIGTAFVATSCAAIVAIIAVKLLERLPAFALPPPSADHPSDQPQAPVPVEDFPAPPPLRPWGIAILSLFACCFIYWFIQAVCPVPWLPPVSLGISGATPLLRAVAAISILAIPFFLSVFPVYAFARRVKVYEEFVEGARDGFNVAIRIIPYLVAILVAIGMFRAAGGIDLIARALGPLLNRVGFPVDLLPVVLVRPLSGSGTLSLFADLVKTRGPDSFIARTAGTIMGSTETTFYVLAVYFGSVGIRRTRHAVLAGLAADLTGVIVSIIICNAVFNHP